MKRLLPLVTLLLASGCGRERVVRWSAVPAANVPLQVDEVAVVAVDRDCAPLADRLARQLDAAHGVQVSPTADIRLHMYECAAQEATVLEEEAGADGTRRRLAVEARAHGVVAVVAGGARTLQLIGAHRALVHSPWGGDVNLRQTRERAHRAVYDGVAMDLATQLAPVPQQITRRVYQRPPTGSPEDFHNQAVAAERFGDLDEALRLAELAVALAPADNAHLTYLRSIQERWR